MKATEIYDRMIRGRNLCCSSFGGNKCRSCPYKHQRDEHIGRLCTGILEDTLRIRKILELVDGLLDDPEIRRIIDGR